MNYYQNLRKQNKRVIDGLAPENVELIEGLEYETVANPTVLTLANYILNSTNPTDLVNLNPIVAKLTSSTMGSRIATIKLLIKQKKMLDHLTNKFEVIRNHDDEPLIYLGKLYTDSEEDMKVLILKALMYIAGLKYTLASSEALIPDEHLMGGESILALDKYAAHRDIIYTLATRENITFLEAMQSLGYDFIDYSQFTEDYALAKEGDKYLLWNQSSELVKDFVTLTQYEYTYLYERELLHNLDIPNKTLPDGTDLYDKLKGS